MARAEEIVRLYENLALLFERQHEPRMRDWFLVLAADAALAAGNASEVERLRGLLLERNPHHMISAFGSFGEALNSPDIKSYVADLRRQYPPAVAEKMWKEQKAPEPTLEFDAEEMTPAASVSLTGSDDPMDLDLGPRPFFADSPAESVGHPHVDLEPLLPDPDLEPEAYRLQSEAAKPAPGVAPSPPRLQPSPPVLPPRPKKDESGPAPRKTVTVSPSTTPTSLPLEPAPAPAPPRSPATFPGYEPLPNKPGREATASEDSEPANRWVAGLLTGLAALLGLSWLVYAVTRPFLPPEWFR